MLDSKKMLQKKIEDIDQMLNDLDIGEPENVDTLETRVNIDINGLDVLDVLHNILN